jgi:hypothetical protein
MIPTAADLNTFPFTGVTAWQRRKWRHVWDMFPRMVDILPEARSGNVRIYHVNLTPKQAIMNCIRRNELWTPGPYCQLEINGEGWMYDTYHERIVNALIVKEARGDVLIAGLGLGMILHPILAKPEVRSVRVLENSHHVARLVMPSLQCIPGAEKLTLEMTDDALKWQPQPGALYDTIWLDCVPMYGYCKMVMDVQEGWLDRFRPFLRRGGWIDHWGYMEQLQYRLNCEYKVTKSVFPMGANRFAIWQSEQSASEALKNGTVHVDRDPEGQWLADVCGEAYATVGDIQKYAEPFLEKAS